MYQGKFAKNNPQRRTPAAAAPQTSDMPELTEIKEERPVRRERKRPPVKKSKNGTKEENIIPMIRALRISAVDDHVLQIEARVCCQNPTLNPMQLHGAVVRHLPELKPDFVKNERIEIYDADGNVFR